MPRKEISAPLTGFCLELLKQEKFFKKENAFSTIFVWQLLDKINQNSSKISNTFSPTKFCTEEQFSEQKTLVLEWNIKFKANILKLDF